MHDTVDEACTREELSHEFGQPELLYHNFVRFVTAANLVFCLVSLGAWVPHARATLPRLAAAGLGWRSPGLVLSQYLNVFFLSSFQASTDVYWAAMLCTSSVLSLAMGPLYFCASLFYFRDASKEQLIEMVIRGTPLDRRSWCLPSVSCALCPLMDRWLDREPDARMRAFMQASIHTRVMLTDKVIRGAHTRVDCRCWCGRAVIISSGGAAACALQHQPLSSASRAWRMTLSYALFAVCFSVPLVLIFLLLFYFTSIAVRQQHSVHTRLMAGSSLSEAEIFQWLLSLVVASFISICNNIFFAIVRCLTNLEGHPTWSGFRLHCLFKCTFVCMHACMYECMYVCMHACMHACRSGFRWHRLLKLYLYRFVNMFVMLVFTYYAELPWYTCMTTRIATQMLVTGRTQTLNPKPLTLNPIYKSRALCWELGFGVRARPKAEMLAG